MKFILYKSVLLFLFSITILNSSSKSVLEKYDFNKGSAAKLTGKLSEISGLVSTPDGKVFGHNDEKGIVYQINYKTGEIIKEFYLTRWAPEKDFEGIAYANKKFYMITSDGVLYEFPEGQNKTAVDYKTYNLNLGIEYNIEGLCYDSKTNSLIFVCKEFPGKTYEGNRAAYSFSLKNFKSDKSPRFLVSLKELKDKFAIKDFYPSAIEKHPATNSYLILSARSGAAIVEIAEDGKLLNAKELKPKNHKQPEGITILPNNDLLIGDEGANKNGTITLYNFIK